VALAPDCQEDFLKEFFAMVVIAGHAMKEAQERRSVPSNQDFQGRTISLGHLRHQCFIARRFVHEPDPLAPDQSCPPAT
jgi:hypothetical protein